MHRFQDYLRAGLIASLLALSATSGVVLAEETAQAKPPAASQDTSGYIREFLSDPKRTGSLAGSILGGALMANPAGPIIGSVIGFFIGKNSMYDEDKARAQQANALYARRDIVPHDTVPTPVPSDVHSIDVVAAAPAPAQVHVQGAPEISGFLREQLVEKCGAEGINDPRLRSLCFYLQGS